MKSVAIIILAAGASRRMGSPKQLLSYKGQTLLAHAAQTALATDCRPIVVVVGAHAQQMRKELDHHPVHIAENPAWSCGIGTSIERGIAALDAIAPPADAALFTLCDQPLVTPDLLQRIADAFRTDGHALVASAYGGTVGVPALFGREFFGVLEDLPAHEGARHVLQRHRARVATIDFPGGCIDIDTPGDYRRL